MQGLKHTIVISSLNCGGAERVAATLANYWAGREAHVSVVTLTSPESPPFFPLVSNIRLIPLNLTADAGSFMAGMRASFRRVLAIRRVIKELTPQLVTSFGERSNIYTILACVGLKTSVVVSEHAVPYMYNPGRVYKLLRRVLYRFADRMVVVSRDAQSYFRPYHRKSPLIIPNPLPADLVGQAAQDRPADAAPRRLIGVGRLVPEKGFDLLLRAFALVSRSHPACTLTIFGEGKERSALERLREELGLTHSVELPGSCAVAARMYQGADLLVLSSRQEAHGNVIVEAMAAGIPVVSFDCPSGPREIIESELNGVLVPALDVDALATAIVALLQDAPRRARFSARGYETSRRFLCDTVMQSWVALAKELVPPVEGTTR